MTFHRPGSTGSKHAVLLIGNFLSKHVGHHNVSEELAERLAGAGHAVLTASSYWARLPRLLDVVGTIWRQRGHYDVACVDLYSGRAFRLAELACGLLRRLGKPIILTLHGGNLPEFSKQNPRRVERLLQGAAVVTTPSSYLLQAFSSLRSDIALVPNPLPLHRYSYRNRSSPRPQLVWLRGFHSQYNPTLAPRVVAELRSQQIDAHLEMVGPDYGDGSLRETRRLVRDLQLEDRVQLVGGIPHGKVPETLARADVFLNTTNVDNTPVSVMEAMASGLCIVSTDVGGLRHLLEHGHDALLVPPRDAGAMSAAIEKLLREPRVAAQLSRNARQKAEKFDWQHVLPMWQTLIDEAASHSSQLR